MDYPDLVFWFNSPPKVERGAFNYVASKWRGSVHYVFTLELRDERRALGWDDDNYGEAKIHRLGVDSNPRQFVSDFVSEHPNAIHIVSGFSPRVSHCLDALTRLVPPKNIAVLSERPGVYGNPTKKAIKRILMPLKQKIIKRKYSSKVSLILALGMTGVEAFESFGWPSCQLAPFMYCPDSSPVRIMRPHMHSQNSQPLRMVYIGRFSSTTKGTDTLLKSVQLIEPQSNWTLDLYGGYGDLVDKVHDAAARDSRIKAFGPTPSIEIPGILTQYDVCIVPSRFDGWNVVVNESLSAGLGTIVTDQAVSHELIIESGAGMVVSSDSPETLAEAIRFAILNREKVASWQSRARKYSQTITPESVGNYLIHILENKMLGLDRKIQAPWLS